MIQFKMVCIYTKQVINIQSIPYGTIRYHMARKNGFVAKALFLIKSIRN